MTQLHLFTNTVQNLVSLNKAETASWRQLLRRGCSMASRQRFAQQDPRRFSQHHLPHGYSYRNLCLVFPPPSRVRRHSWAACTEAPSRQRALHLEVSLEAPAAGHSIELTVSTSDNFRDKLKESSQCDLKAQKGEDKRTLNILFSP